MRRKNLWGVCNEGGLLALHNNYRLRAALGEYRPEVLGAAMTVQKRLRANRARQTDRQTDNLNLSMVIKAMQLRELCINSKPKNKIYT